MSVFRGLLIGAVALIVLHSGSARAGVPDLIPVQGVLSDSYGQLYSGTVGMEFRIYDQQSGGTVLWTEIRDELDAVTVDGGMFTVYLGALTTLNLAELITHDQLWLGMRVGDDAEMNRVRIGAVLFAYEAEVCRQVGELTEQEIQPVLSDSAACPEGYYLRGWDAGSGSPICEADQSSPTTYTAGSGLTLDGNEFSVGADALTSSHLGSGSVGTDEIQDGAVTKEKINDKILVYQNNEYCEDPGTVTQATTCQTRICNSDNNWYYECDGTCLWYNSSQTCDNNMLGYLISAD